MRAYETLPFASASPQVTGAVTALPPLPPLPAANKKDGEGRGSSRSVSPSVTSDGAEGAEVTPVKQCRFQKVIRFDESHCAKLDTARHPAMFEHVEGTHYCKVSARFVSNRDDITSCYPLMSASHITPLNITTYPLSITPHPLNINLGPLTSPLTPWHHPLDP
eukprot:1189614-Prorocentrum_minimum.AAC.3